MNKENVISKYDDKKIKDMEKFCNEYKTFLSTCKTERECINQITKMAANNGYISLDEALKNNKKLKCGDKVYAVNMGKAMMLMVIGEHEMVHGLNFVGAHIDSPRLDLKANPVYENNGLCLLDTHYYGGIKKYQWTTLPLAIHGTVVKKDGKKIDFVYGEDENDGVVGISDLLPHLEKPNKLKLRAKT